MTLNSDWKIILCRPKHWRLVPVWYSETDKWPKLYKFHWLFLFVQREVSP